LVVVDCRFNLDRVDEGRAEYAVAHVPGAVYAHLNDDLSAPPTGTNGRHPLPAPATFEKTLGRLGISNDSQVVAYDQDSGMYASRLWWMLRWMGHDAVAVLDGGFDKWTAEGRPVSSGLEQREGRPFVGHPRADLVATVDSVAALAERPDWRLLDARAAERFRGEVEPLDRVAGHIPGALNHHYKNNLSANGTFRPAEELRRELGRTLGDTPADHLVCYCGSGVSACHNLLALEAAGMRGAKLYVGSWSEWSGDPARPVERSTGC
jgi:thiosulfate/3-mercaptopyruvate sulfurtransferase